jgi:membrane protein implicated in regulation of membrane protease activity
MRVSIVIVLFALLLSLWLFQGDLVSLGAAVVVVAIVAVLFFRVDSRRQQQDKDAAEAKRQYEKDAVDNRIKACATRLVKQMGDTVCNIV